jgi:hypothetical protein
MQGVVRLLDATGKLWATGALSGKFAGTFFSTASQVLCIIAFSTQGQMAGYVIKH